MAELRFKMKLAESIWHRYWANCFSDNDESNDGNIAAIGIEHNRRILDGAEHHFNFSYLRFKTLAYF
jgi:hypothetical protein